MIGLRWLGGPLGLYRLPRREQVLALALWAHLHRAPQEAAQEPGSAERLPGRPVEGASSSAARPRRWPRPRGVVAVSEDARERSDRFRVA